MRNAMPAGDRRPRCCCRLIQDKGAEVLRVVVGAQAGWAVVAASGGQPGSMERVDGGPIGAGDGDMGWPAQRPVGVDPESGLPSRPKPAEPSRSISS
jgi:hypothetical protein